MFSLTVVISDFVSFRRQKRGLNLVFLSASDNKTDGKDACFMTFV